MGKGPRPEKEGGRSCESRPQNVLQLQWKGEETERNLLQEEAIMCVSVPPFSLSSFLLQEVLRCALPMILLSFLLSRHSIPLASMSLLATSVRPSLSSINQAPSPPSLFQGP